MNGVPSSTYFTTAPHWEWLIVLYFFLGGLAGGCYFLAALIDLFGRDEDGRTVSNPSIGYGVLTRAYADGRTRELYQIGLSANTVLVIHQVTSKLITAITHPVGEPARNGIKQDESAPQR